MAIINFIPQNTQIDFIKHRFILLFITAVIVLGSIGAFFVKGLNYGIDFKGGFVIEVRTPEKADLAKLRSDLNALNIGDVKLQDAGTDRDVLIRIERQPGDDKAQNATIDRVRATLGNKVEYRRVETVGPKVSETLKKNGTMAVVLALLAMMVYVWFRFEWQFGVVAVWAQINDCLSIIGLYALTGLDFNETALIAILTTAGYSINDTVVIYDRIRENLRRYKKMPLAELINKSTNQTLSRTILTSSTTLLSLFAMYYFGGPVIEAFTLPIICGVAVGTFSSICFASIMLLYFGVRSEDFQVPTKE